MAIIPIWENRIEKNMENEVEIVVTQGLVKFILKSCMTLLYYSTMIPEVGVLTYPMNTRKTP